MNVISPFVDKLVKYIKYNKIIIFNNTQDKPTPFIAIPFPSTNQSMNSKNTQSFDKLP